MQTSERAQTLALQALGWLVGEEELLPVFLGATGAGEADLRARAKDPVFQGAVLDFILMDDAWVVACAQAIGTAPETLAAARHALPGGAEVSWT